MKIVLISDTHEKHNKFNIPDGDILIHAGDFTMLGEVPHILDFNEWLGYLPHRHKVVIAGNHDLLFEHDARKAESLLTNCTYLRDSLAVIDGLRIYGSPWTPTFGNGWVFNADPRKMRVMLSGVPDKVDILVTHGSAFGTLDTTQMEQRSVGSTVLWDVIHRVKPKIHVFGHIHEEYGMQTYDNGTVAYNASLLDLTYQPVNKPWVVEI